MGTGKRSVRTVTGAPRVSTPTSLASTHSGTESGELAERVQPLRFPAEVRPHDLIEVVGML